MTIYCGYDIAPAPDGKFYWVDQHQHEHHGFPTEEAAMDSIDTYRRNKRHEEQS